MDKNKYNPSYSDWHGKEITTEIEEVEVHARFSLNQYRQQGFHKIKNILETSYKFLTGIPIREEINPIGNYIDFFQKQRRIKQHQVPSGGEYKIPGYGGGEPTAIEIQMRKMMEMYNQIPPISYKDMMPDDKNHPPKLKNFFDPYMQELYEQKERERQERKRQEKQQQQQQQQSTPTPPPEIYPLNIFSVEDLNDSK